MKSVDNQILRANKFRGWLTISCRVSSRPVWLSVIACWCFFPRKWLNKYTSDGI